jgi:prepilin-type N-terminal cleavage/methylation domain-containing protein
MSSTPNTKFSRKNIHQPRLREKISKFLGFTLVELIVVITILAILGTIGFFSIRNYAATARDSVRVTDLKNNIKALAMLQIKTTTLPLPENPIKIMSGTGVIISYQGYLGPDISRVIGMSTLSLDPKDKSKYTYAIDATQKKSQFMAYLES